MKNHFLPILVAVCLLASSFASAMQPKDDQIIDTFLKQANGFFENEDGIILSNAAHSFMKKETKNWSPKLLVSCANHDGFKKFMAQRFTAKDEDTLLHFATTFERNARKTDSKERKNELCKTALNLAQKVYCLEKPTIWNKTDARTLIEKIQTDLPSLKAHKTTTDLFAKEDAPMVRAREYMANIKKEKENKKQQPTQSPPVSKKSNKAKAPKKKEAEKKDDITQTLIEFYKDEYQKKEYAKSAQSCWRVMVNSPENSSAYTHAYNHLQQLAKINHNPDAYYFLSVLPKIIPQRRSIFFLYAEDLRDTDEEHKNGTCLEQKIENPESQSIITVTGTSEAMCLATQALHRLDTKKYGFALHALATHYCNNSLALPSLHIRELSKAKELSEEALNVYGEDNSDYCYSYSAILNFLGVALFGNAMDAMHSNNRSALSLMPTASTISEAARYLKMAVARGHLYSAIDLGAIQEFQFLVNENDMSKLTEAISTYTAALNKGCIKAGEQMEKLLLRGLHGIPLNLTQRTTLLENLKEQTHYAPQILNATSYEQSPYYHTAQETPVPGAHEFYKALYHWDRGERAPALELFKQAYRKDHGGAECVLMNIELTTNLIHKDTFVRLEKVQEFLRDQLPKMAHPSKIIIGTDCSEALEHMQNDDDAINALYTKINVLVLNQLPDTNPIKTIKELFDRTEHLLMDKPNHPFRKILTCRSFLQNLVVFAKTNHDPSVLIHMAKHAIFRIERHSSAMETVQCLLALRLVAQLLNDDLKMGDFNTFTRSTESKTMLIKEIDRILSQEKAHDFTHSTTLTALRYILHGEPQDEDAIFSNTPLKQLGGYPSSFRMGGSEDMLKKIFSKHTELGLIATITGNTLHVADCMVHLIHKFRINNAASLYENLTHNHKMYTIFQETLKTQKKHPHSVQLLMQQKLIWIAHCALIEGIISPEDWNKNRDRFEPYLQEIAELHPVLGNAMIARCFSENILFSPNKEEAVRHIKLALHNKTNASLEEHKYIVNAALIVGKLASKANQT